MRTRNAPPAPGNASLDWRSPFRLISLALPFDANSTSTCGHPRYRSYRGRDPVADFHGGFAMRGTFFAAATLYLTLAGIVAAQEFVPPFADARNYLASTGPDAVQAPAGKADMVQAPDLGKEGPCDDFDCCFKACQFPCIYFQADALYWDRVGTGCDEVLVINTNTSEPLFSTNDLNFNGAGGARFLIGWQPHHCCNCCAWELSYWGLYNWNADGEVTAPGTLAIPGDLGAVSNNFFGADQILLDYRSELHNVEFNCIKSCCTDCAKIDFIMGFRYLAL